MRPSSLCRLNSYMAENEEELGKDVKLFHIYEATITQHVYHIYLSHELGHPTCYADMIFSISAAAENDIIVMHLNTPGGQLNTGIQIINAIRSTQAHVICSLEAEAHSMASLIFLAGDEFVVHDNSMMLLHNFSGGIQGKGHEMAASVEGTKKWFQDTASKLYYPFLTHAEIKRVFKGEDLYLHSEDIAKRLKRVMAKLEKEQEEAMGELEFEIPDEPE